MTALMTSHVAKATAAWGADLPDWVLTLATHCDRSSQSVVGRQLDRSAAMISQVLAGKYDAKTTRLEERVRGVLMNGIILCPALGDLPTHECQDWREKARTFAVGNPLRLRMFRACAVCPVNRKEGGL